jgi:hypothetical protein
MKQTKTVLRDPVYMVDFSVFKPEDELRINLNECADSCWKWKHPGACLQWCCADIIAQRRFPPLHAFKCSRCSQQRSRRVDAAIGSTSAAAGVGKMPGMDAHVRAGGEQERRLNHSKCNATSAGAELVRLLASCAAAAVTAAVLHAYPPHCLNLPLYNCSFVEVCRWHVSQETHKLVKKMFKKRHTYHMLRTSFNSTHYVVFGCIPMQMASM